MEIDLRYDAKIKGLVFKNKPDKIDPQLELELQQLNTICTELIGILDAVPSPPTPENFNKDMSRMISKLYEGGVQAFKNGKIGDSEKQFTIAIEVINRRNKFEAFQGILQELGILLMARADTYLAGKKYVQAFNDADMLIGLMMCSPDNFLRRGVANYFLENYEDARADFQRGLAFDPQNEKLKAELNNCLDKILEENGDYL